MYKFLIRKQKYQEQSKFLFGWPYVKARVFLTLKTACERLTNVNLRNNFIHTNNRGPRNQKEL